MSRLINKTRVKRYVILRANEKAPCDMPDKVTDHTGRDWDYSRCFKHQKRFTQISESFLETLEAEFRVLVDKKLSNLPRTGKTVK